MTGGVVHYRDLKFATGRHAWCGTRSPAGLSDEWRDVSCQKCLAKRKAWRRKGWAVPSIHNPWYRRPDPPPAPLVPLPVEPDEDLGLIRRWLSRRRARKARRRSTLGGHQPDENSGTPRPRPHD